jgi:hypothetical protein
MLSKINLFIRRFEEQGHQYHNYLKNKQKYFYKKIELKCLN